jgi:hypothetical protein
MKSILFFDPTIRIAVHSATRADDVNRTMTVEDFADGDAVALYEMPNGDYRVEARENKRLPGNARFIEGPEIA